jgi:hypothetical protein
MTPEPIMLVRLWQVSVGLVDWHAAYAVSSALEKLQRVLEVPYDAQRHKGCMQGTRVGVLSELEEWSKNTDAPPIFWLSGMAGVGKTSVALSFCEKLDEMGILGGSFFCSRTGSASQSDVTRVIPTLARLLALKDKAFIIALKKQLDQEPDAAHKNIGRQIELLLRKPLATHSLTTIPPLSWS